MSQLAQLARFNLVFACQSLPFRNVFIERAQQGIIELETVPVISQSVMEPLTPTW